MKQIWYIFLATLQLSILGCTSVAVAKSEFKYNFEQNTIKKEEEEQFEKQFRQFIQIVDESLTLRREAKLFFKKLDNKLSGDEHLTSHNQKVIKFNFDKYKKNHEALEQFIGKYNIFSNEDVSIIYPSNRPSKIVKRTNDQNEIIDVAFQINPEDKLGKLMIYEIKMWLSSKMIIFDNYVVTLVRYMKNSESRRQFDLENIDQGGKEFLEKIDKEMTDNEKYERTEKIIKLVSQIIEYEKDHPSQKRDKVNTYFNTIIEGSYAYHRIPKLTYAEEWEIENRSMENAFNDYVSSLSSEVISSISALFGNTIGLYEERKGKLNDMPQIEQTHINDKLKLLDILFEKTPFRLTDLFIPGHWGHVAIWVGGEKDIPELKRLGVWQELPRIEETARKNFGYEGLSFQTLIKQNYSIIEALREGVQANTLEHFMNIDDLAVIRNVQLTDKQKKEYLLSAFSQIGKGYDFNFDVETNQEIVCSELIFVVYSDYNWPVENTLGRYTVSPDHAASLALKENDPFDPILIYHDGQKLPKQYNRENFNLLMKGQYNKIIFKSN